jgi:hypothetical protein
MATSVYCLAIDALSQGQSSLNDLAKATAAYDMSNNKLQNLGAAASVGEALGVGQTGGHLNGLDLNSQQLSSLSPANSAGQALAFGQNGGQLKITSGTIAVNSQSPNVASSTPVTSQGVSAPAGLTNGDVEVATLHFSAGGIAAGNFVIPTGWTHIRHDTSVAGSGGETVTTGLWWHCVTNAATEPTNYTWNWTKPQLFRWEYLRPYRRKLHESRGCQRRRLDCGRLRVHQVLRSVALRP